MDNKKVSIVIPAYNVVNYVHRAIDSSLQQTYPFIEIIIVDDGSLDGTWSVIETYARDSTKIRAYRQENAGVSAARNFALSLCRGDFIIFLDSDDWLELNAIETLLCIQKSNHDLLVCCDRYFAYFDKDNSIYKERQSQNDEISIINLKEALLTTGTGEYNLQSSCYKLFKREIIEKNSITFSTNIYHGEDGLFVFKYLQYCKGIAFSGMPLWNILERPGSATTSPYNSKWLTLVDSVTEMLRITNDSEVKKVLFIYEAQRIIFVAKAYIKSNTVSSGDLSIIKGNIRELIKNCPKNILPYNLWIKLKIVESVPEKILMICREIM